MSTYTVRATRDGRFWLIEVPELGHYTQARNVGEVETMARDLIAMVLEVDPASVVLDVEITMPGGAAEHLRRAEEARAEEARARTEAAEQVRAAAAGLRDAGVSLRDIGRLLGVSFQRAGQLTATRERGAVPEPRGEAEDAATADTALGEQPD